MGNTPSNDSEHWVKTLKKGVIGLRKFVVAVNTPVDESEYLLKYGKIILNTQSGLFKFGDVAFNLNQSHRIYKIIRILILSSGSEVAYKDIAQAVNLPYAANEKNEETKTKIKLSIRDLRRRLKINALENKEANPFIMTGNGIKLAFFSK